ncbi:MAG TPA: hypothetical protein DCQ06_10375 [Myxococcales bacterium]|nr:hypothetical protein [Myxococcales bacterium]
MKLSAASGAATDTSALRANDGQSGLELKLQAARAKVGSGGAMSAASAFLIEEPPEPEQEQEGEDDEADEDPEEQEGPVEASYEVTQLPLKLLGTMVVRPQQYSSATMEVNRRDKKIVIVGYELLGGQARVEEIHRTYVVLKESGKLTIAPLWPRPKSAKPKATAKNFTTSPNGLRGARVKTGGRSRASKSNNGVRKLSSTSYQIERSMLNRKLKNLAALGQQARVVPNYHRGRYDGFRMIGMGSSSLFRDIGFQNGDIVKVINGNQIDSPNKALALYEGLKNKSRLTIQLERGGMLKTLRYIVR